jgi:hypothetical protein
MGIRYYDRVFGLCLNLPFYVTRPRADLTEAFRARPATVANG